MSTREERARRLLDLAALSQDVDVDRLWARVDQAVAPRQPREASGRQWLSVAAAVAVTAGLVGAVAWAGAQQKAAPAVPAGGGEPTVTLHATPTVPTTTSQPPPTTGATPEASQPEIPGNIALPENQRFANYSPTTSGWHIEGRVDGLAKLHIRGKAVNLVLAPGVMVNENDRPAVCEIYVPATEAISRTGAELGRYESCSALPWPNGNRVRGGLSFAGLDGSVVDEWDGWVTMSLATAPEVARVDYSIGGRTVTLQHRFSDPAWGGAYFIGFYATDDESPQRRSPGDGVVTYFDNQGRVLADEQLH